MENKLAWGDITISVNGQEIRGIDGLPPNPVTKLSAVEDGDSITVTLDCALAASCTRKGSCKDCTHVIEYIFRNNGFRGIRDLRPDIECLDDF